MLSAWVLLGLSLILVIINLIIGNMASSFFVPIIIMLFSLIYVSELQSKKNLKDVWIPLALGYLFRIALLLWDLYARDIFVLPHAASDDDTFYRKALQLSMGMKTSNYGSYFTKLISQVLVYCGSSRLFVQFLSMLCSVIALHSVAKMLEIIGTDKKTKITSMYLICLLPNYAILSSILRRESLIIVFVTVSLHCFLLWFYRKKFLWLLLAFGFVFCAAIFHAGVVALAVGYIVVEIIYDSRRETLTFSGSGIIMSVFFLMAFVFLYNNYGTELFYEVQGVESIENIATVATKGGSSYAAYVGNSDTPINLVIYTIPRIVYFLFSPFPWQWRGLADIISTLFGSVFYIVTMIRAIRYLLRGNQKDRTLVIIFLILVMCVVFVFGWGVSNTGTAIRHRDKMIAMYIILYALSTPERRSVTKNDS